jgi:hypothetical protein
LSPARSARAGGARITGELFADLGKVWHRLPPALRAPILYSLRSFLLWAGERGDHALHPDAVREALRVGKTIRREAAGKGATAEWSAAVRAFLSGAAPGKAEDMGNRPDRGHG